MYGSGGDLNSSRFWLAASASLSLVAFVHRALRATAVSPGTVPVSVFWSASFILYLAAVIRAARRVGRMPPAEAQAELLRVAGAGFVLVYFALELS